MACSPYPVYNTNASTVTASGCQLPVTELPGVVCSDNRDGRHKREMIIAVPVTHSREGLRPVELTRDLPQVIELLRLVFGESLDGDSQQLIGDGPPGFLDSLSYRMNPAASRLSNGFVWQADGRIVGNATMLSTRAWDRYLVANVAVHPSFRRQGIARRLMEAITSSVKARGGRVILLQVVTDNSSAVDLYKSLGYTSIGNMTTWYSSSTKVRPIHIDPTEQSSSNIVLLNNRRWREAYQLDTAHVHPDLNWPEPLQYDAYRRSLWQRATDFMNGSQFEAWVTTDNSNNLTGMASIRSEWGRSHIITLRVRPSEAGQLEKLLLGKAIRRLSYLPQRNVRIDHPEADELTGMLLKESNFSIQRTLTHMRLEIPR